MPSSSDDQRIRKGLRFLSRADRAIIRAAAPLERLEGDPNPLGIADLLEGVTFSVGGNSYEGMITQAQYEYLQGYTAGSLRQFADAIARVLVKMNGKLVDVLADLGSALDVPAPAGAAAGVEGAIDTPATGCCTYDTNQQKNGITQSFCEGGLQGQWSPNPCVGQPIGKRRTPVRARSAR